MNKVPGDNWFARGGIYIASRKGWGRVLWLAGGLVGMAFGSLVYWLLGWILP